MRVAWRRRAPAATSRRRTLAAFLGGGEGTFGGDLFLAFIAGVAFATILAVVAGLVLSASAAFSHDIWSSIVRKGQDSEHEEVLVARIAAFAIGVIAIIIAIIGGSGLNVSFMVGLAFAVAASANFPALLLALSWRRFNTTGAITGVVIGVVSAIFLVIVSPKVWPGADTVTGSPIGWDAQQPGHRLDPARVPRLHRRHDAQQRAASPSAAASTSCSCGPRQAWAPSARWRRFPKHRSGGRRLRDVQRGHHRAHVPGSVRAATAGSSWRTRSARRRPRAG